MYTNLNFASCVVNMKMELKPGTYVSIWDHRQVHVVTGRVETVTKDTLTVKDIVLTKVDDDWWLDHQICTVHTRPPNFFGCMKDLPFLEGAAHKLMVTKDEERQIYLQQWMVIERPLSSSAPEILKEFTAHPESFATHPIDLPANTRLRPVTDAEMWTCEELLLSPLGEVGVRVPSGVVSEKMGKEEPRKMGKEDTLPQEFIPPQKISKEDTLPLPQESIPPRKIGKDD